MGGVEGTPGDPALSAPPWAGLSGVRRGSRPPGSPAGPPPGVAAGPMAGFAGMITCVIRYVIDP